MKHAWKKNSSKKVFETKWFYIDEEQLVSPAGKDLTYFTLRKPPGAVVLPFDGERFYMVKVFRPSVWKYSWEFPMGVADAPTMEGVAQIELREETGFSAGTWLSLGKFAGSPGSADQMGEAFLAESLTAGTPERDDGEADMELTAFTPAQIDSMIASGDIFDSWTITPWYFYKLYLLKK